MRGVPIGGCYEHGDFGKPFFRNPVDHQDLIILI
jgi:hypothetical protein